MSHIQQDKVLLFSIIAIVDKYIDKYMRNKTFQEVLLMENQLQVGISNSSSTTTQQVFYFLHTIR